MDKNTKSYIDSLVTPLVARIQALETSNQELRARVRHLQQLVSCQPSYQRPTLSARQHMRESRISNKGSEIKKNNWNSNTKYDSPTKPTSTQVSHQKIKTKPPIPKIMKSPPKPQKQENYSNESQKKITGGTRLPADKNQDKNNMQNIKSNTRPNKVKKQNNSNGEHVLHSSNYVVVVQPINKFQQLVKQNTVIVQEMKQVVDKKQQANYPNLVLKVDTPKSEHNHSSKTSPNSRSFIS